MLKNQLMISLVCSLTCWIFLQCTVRADLHGFVDEYESAFAMIPTWKSFAKSHAHLSDAVQLQVFCLQLFFIFLLHTFLVLEDWLDKALRISSSDILTSLLQF